MSINSISASVYRIKRTGRVMGSTNKQTKCQSTSYKVKVKVNIFGGKKGEKGIY